MIHRFYIDCFGDTPLGKHTYKLTLTLVSLIFLNASMPAKSMEAIPDSAQPGRIEQEFKTLRIPKSNAKAFIPGQQDLIAPEGANEITFQLNGIQFLGVSVFDQAFLGKQFSAFINKNISLADLYTIANELTVYYRNQGYILSQALVPAQKIDDDGIATIQVVEGFISDINLSGVSEKQAKRIAKITQKIQKSQPLRADILERYLLILNDFGGVNFSATLAPSQTQGAADITLNITEKNYDASFDIENRGTEIVGPERLTAQVSINNIFNAFDANNLTVVSTGNSELNYISLRNDSPIGNNGWHLVTAVTTSRSQPGGELEILEIESRGNTFSIGAEYPFIRSRTKNLSLRSHLDIYNNESTRLSSAENSESLSTEDRIRSIRLGAVFDNIDSFRGINLIDVEFSQGLDILNASELGDSQLSRELGDPKYRKLNLYAARLQSIAPHWSLLFSLNGQYSNDNLLSAEQFGVGGKNFGGAYDSSEIIGDTGIAGRIELRFSKSLPDYWFRNIVAYSFLDGGEIKRNAPSVGQEDRESLSSYGFGIRYRTGKYISGSLEYALPNNRDIASEGNDDGRLFFNLKATF